MRNFDKRVALGIVIIGLICLIWLVATGSLIWFSLEADDREAILSTLGPRLMLLILMWAVSLVAVGFALRWLVAYFMTAPARLFEDAQVLLGTDVKKTISPRGSIENRNLTNLLNQLVEQRESLREEMDKRVLEAAQITELEKNRLAALMSELTKSVVVCNLDGRITLYNNRARLQFKSISKNSAVGSGSELIGLGRSIYAVFDRKLLTHALEDIQQRLNRGATAPSAQFVTTTKAGKLLRVQMAPVRSVRERQEGKPVIRGFVLLTENITNEFSAQSRQDYLLQTLTEHSRSAATNIQLALEVLEAPNLDDNFKTRLFQILKEEADKLGQRLHQLDSQSSEQLLSRWPLEDMLGSDLVDAAVRRIHSLNGPKRVETEIDESIWLKVESFSLLQTLAFLAERVHQICGVEAIKIKLKLAENRAHLDFCWQPLTHDAEATATSWETETITVSGESAAMTMQDVAERHSGVCWFSRNPETENVFFRFLLPLATPQENLQSADLLQNESRPEYYDFDLFQSSAQTRSLEDAKLTELSYTIFDTETTGLNPAEGDEIIQIGAIRMFNGKLLQQETFDQLVDPQREIPAATVPIHGIEPEMVLGQPTIDEVLPAFHSFCTDTVLVAHNAAFDMRCLQVKETSTGIVFDHPVLDTLLLSAVVHPNQESHKLEAIAERFNVNILGRHTALGDAMATAEIFVHLVPLLNEKGIFTLRQAREASQKTYFARLKY